MLSCDTPFEYFTESSFGVVQSCANRSDGTTNHERNFGVAQIVPVTKEQYLPLRRCNGGHRGFHSKSVQHHKAGVVARADFWNVRRRAFSQLILAFLLSQLVDGTVPGYAKQPGSERSRIGQATDSAVHREPDLLMDIVRLLAYQTTQVAERALAELVEKLGESLLVTRLAPQH